MSTVVVRNTSLLTLSSVIQKLVSFAYFTIIARLIGVENTGQYFFAISFTTLFTVVADFGLGSVLTREGAREPGRLASYVQTVFSAKILFGVLAYGGVVLAAYLLNYSADTRLLILLSGITMFFDNLQTAFYSAFRSMQNLVYEAAGNIGAQILTLGIGTVALLLKAPLYWLILAYSIPSALICVYAGFVLSTRYNITLQPRFDSVALKAVLIIALPFAAASIIGRLYSYADLLIMSKLLTPTDIGWWSVPYKIVYAFQFIPAALSASLYPAFSSFFGSDKERIGPLYIKAIRYLALFSVPLATGLLVLAEPMILWLYGESYLPSVPVLKLLALTLVCTYTSLLTGALLNATHRQKLQTILITAALVVNVTVNLVFIPALKIEGAALAALIASLILVLTGFMAAQSVLKIAWFKFVAPFVQFLVPAAVMGYAVNYSLRYVSLIPAILIGVAVYGLLLFVFRMVTVDDFKNAFGSWRG